jgi:hypothetical protein
MTHVVAVSRLNLRRGPSTGYGIIVTLVRGDRGRSLATSGSWRKLETAKGTGWVYDPYLNKITNGTIVSSAGFINLPASGEGFYSYQSAYRRWGVPRLIYGIQRAARRYTREASGRPRLGTGDISKELGGAFSPHVSHRYGTDLDARPMRNDGLEQSVRHTDSAYSRSLTQRILDLLKSELDEILILFNDTAIPGTTWYSGHSNHFHFRISRTATTSPTPTTAAAPAAATAVAPTAADQNLAQMQLAAVRSAQEELAAGVIEVPLGSNRGPRVDEYATAAGMSLGLRWCGFFASWNYTTAARNAGRSFSGQHRLHSVEKLRDWINYRSYTSTWTATRVTAWEAERSRHRDQGSTRTWMALRGSAGHSYATNRNLPAQIFDSYLDLPLRPGDFVLWPRHITTVESYDGASGRLVTIDGNYSDRVIRRTHDLSSSAQRSAFVGFGRPAWGDFPQ